jgi:hypothetical protein
MPTNKHVIFLGAGASASSGYPVARALTKVMAHRLEFLNYVVPLIERDRPKDKHVLIKLADTHFACYAEASKLLKAGCFETMDELSSLARGGKKVETIISLKKLLRFIFGLDDPNTWHWGTSDYPNFVHALFGNAEVPRDDICIISFNYDPYLEFLLWEALMARGTLRTVSAEKAQYLQQAATSGFYDPKNLGWLELDGFKHLKLHGTCVLPPNEERKVNRVFTWNTLLNPDMMVRYSVPRDPHFVSQAPPVLLPWEIIDPAEARLLSYKEIIAATGAPWGHLDLIALFTGLWQKAHEEVQRAQTISFIGISFGNFLVPELRFLFSEKLSLSRLELIVANPSNEPFLKSQNDRGRPTERKTPIGRIYHLLRDLCPQYGTVSGRPFNPNIFQENVTTKSYLGFDQFIGDALSVNSPPVIPDD